VRTHVFELSRKDGYLATNSLLLDAMLVARAYGELDGEKNQLPTSIDLLEIDGRSAALWVDGAAEFVKSAVSCGAVVVVFSPQLKAIAADLESKLAEAALLHCQFADLRSFAHGRHLWLAERPGDIAVLAITEPSLHGLWLEMKKLFPSNTATHEMALSGASPRDLIAGLTAQMYFVGAVAKRLGRDPGRPKVPQFGRDLYYVDLPKVIPGPEESEADIDGAKYDVLGARWPSSRTRLDMVRARKSYADAMTKRRFRAIVFDYDGTLVGSQRNHSPPSERILYHIRRLVEGGVVVGVASGRGGSVQEALAQSLSDSELEKIQLGLYNGGWIGDARTPPQDKKVTSEFLSHVTRIVRKLEPLGVPIEGIRTTHPYQVSIRFRDGLPTDQMWFVVADSLRQAGLDIGTMVRSKHSVDVLAQGVTKSRLIAHVIEKFKVDPYDVVTVGDQGAWPGNDSTLLEHRYSLSVDMPSRRIDRGWKFAPSHKRDVDATTWYLDRIEIATGGSFKFLLEDSAQG
jgi:HAD superfamily hydrolase (TIGR01484 family)